MNQQCSTSPHLFDPRFHAVWGVLWGGGDWDNKPFRLRTCEDFLACKRATLGMKHGGGSHALEWIYQPNRIVLEFSLSCYILWNNLKTGNENPNGIDCHRSSGRILQSSCAFPNRSFRLAEIPLLSPMIHRLLLRILFKTKSWPCIGMYWTTCVFRGHPHQVWLLQVFLAVFIGFHRFLWGSVRFVSGRVSGIGSLAVSVAGSAAQRRTALSRQAGWGGSELKSWGRYESYRVFFKVFNSPFWVVKFKAPGSF